MPRLLTLVLATLLSLSLGLAGSVRAEDALFTQVGRVVAVGDLHGDYEQYVRVLKHNKLVNDKLKWTGSDTHLVQLGDVTDRGPDSLKIIRHLMELEKQARKSGGRVHVLIGNHEAMNVNEDLRYVHPGEFSQLVTRRSVRNKNQYLSRVFRAMKKNRPELISEKNRVMQRLRSLYPLGYVEHRELWSPGREIAKWYAAHPAVIQINDTIFLHGGLNPHQESFKRLNDINATIQKELSPGGVPEMSIDPAGPLWYRGLANQLAETELEPLERMLAFYDAKRIMIGHTPTAGAIMPRFNGRVILADVGLSAHYGSGMANVLIEDEKVYAIHRGQPILLPTQDIDAYLKQVVALEPEDSRLTKFVNQREKAALAPPDNSSAGQRVSN